MVASAAMASPLRGIRVPTPAVACATMPGSDATVNGEYGRAVRRREDPPLIKGQGLYTDDLRLPDELHAAFVRSEVAHGRIASIDTDAAAGAPGVAAVYTAADLELQAFGPGPMAPDDMLRDADVVVRARYVNQRLAAVPMEPAAAVAAPEEGGVRLWVPCQAPHSARDVAAASLGMDKDAVRVTIPNVGGGFGARIPPYPEQVAIAAAALRLDRPVRYVESRWETMIAMQHGRAQVQDVELG